MTAISSPVRYIAKSEHNGSWVKTVANGSYRLDTYTARELAEFGLPRVATGEFVLWTAASTRQGNCQLFYRERMVPQPDGSLAVYASDGHLVIIHPADRKILIRTK